MIKALHSERWFPRFFTGWCLAALTETCIIPYPFTDKSFLSQVNFWRMVILIALSMAVLTAISFRKNRETFETRLLVLAVFAYLFRLALDYHNFWFSLSILLILFFVLQYATAHDRLHLQAWRPSKRQVWLLIGIAALFFTVYTATVTVLRYYGHFGSTFDLGIFSQMFYYMKTTGLPLTTCERGALLSHFAVHVSPIYYLLLPGYLVFSSPAYLQIMQVLVLASAVIPLYLLLQTYHSSLKTTLAICLCFCAYPALTGGCMYDVHENCFLTPLLLWLCYCFERKRTWGIYLFAVLTLLVKEDAAIYVAAFALYLLCARKNYRHGSILLLLSVCYFFFSTAILSAYGEGVMTASRFSPYLIHTDHGMTEVLRSVFTNPGYLFSQVFTTAKLKFILLMLLPLAGIPLYGKKISQLVLFIPLLLVNLMPDWQYQYSTHFQYVFGGIALLFYLAVINVQDISAHAKACILPLVVTGTVLLAVVDLSGYTSIVSTYLAERETNRTIAATLSAIPADASVSCDGYLLPAISNRRELYDTTQSADAEYIVLDLRPGKEENSEQDAYYQQTVGQFRCIAHENDVIAVYQRIAGSQNS